MSNQLAEPSTGSTSAPRPHTKRDYSIRERFSALLERMMTTFASKDAAYAGEEPLANIRSSRVIGIAPSTACYIRMTDKFHRMGNLIRDGHGAGVLADANRDESVLDNAFDLAVYALIYHMLRSEEMGRVEIDIRQWGARSGADGELHTADTDCGYCGSTHGDTHSPTCKRPTHFNSNVSALGDGGQFIYPRADLTAIRNLTNSDPRSDEPVAVADPIAKLASNLYTWYTRSFSPTRWLPFHDLDKVTQRGWHVVALEVMTRARDEHPLTALTSV